MSSNEYIVKFGSNSQAQRVCIRVSDLAGNISDKVCTWNVLVDGEAPTNVMNIKSSAEGNHAWYRELTLVVDVEDNHSGVASARYCFTTGDKCNPDTEVSISKDNNYTVTFESNKVNEAQKMCVNVTDKAGNTSGEYCSGKFSVDTVNPTAKIKAEVDDCNAGITVSAEGSKDGESGIWKYQYKLDNGQWYESDATTYNFTNVFSGNHTVYVRVTDYAGRASETSTTVTVSPITLLTEKIKQCVPRLTSGDGLYEVSHSDVLIGDLHGIVGVDNLIQTELRYAGINSNNYVTFNDETWRIIGLVNTPEGQRVKIIRNESIGDYSWDSSLSTENAGLGINEWNKADLMKLLNGGAYYYRNNDNIYCFSGSNSKRTSCDFTNTGLTITSKNMIDTVTWSLGANDDIDSPSKYYTMERGSTGSKKCSTGTYCNDSVTRELTWRGKVGLIYPSDYRYATSDRTCLTNFVDAWYSNCYNNDWLYTNDLFQWTITPNATSTSASFVVSVYGNGNVSNRAACNASATYPTVHLLSNVKVTSGDGSSSSPYSLTL